MAGRDRKGDMRGVGYNVMFIRPGGAYETKSVAV
jgi:hypothetical protein